MFSPKWINFTYDTPSVYDSVGASLPEPRDCILMERSGYKDVNGIKTFEFDIIEAYGVKSRHDTKIGVATHSYKAFKGYGWWMVPDFREERGCSLASIDFKIIGNIFENTDLVRNVLPLIIR